MKNLYILFYLFLFFILSCDSVETLPIKNESDLNNALENEYIKVAFQSEDLHLKKCEDFNFTFDEVEIVKLSKSDFMTIKNGLKEAKLNSLQVSNDVDLLVEYQGVRFCMNHLGEMLKNNRKLQNNPDLVYLIKSKSNYYDFFEEDTLLKYDTLIRRNSTPFGYSYRAPVKNGTLLENDSLKVEAINYRTTHNIILTY